MEAKRFFTPEEANRLLPALEELFNRVFTLRSAMDEYALELGDESFEEMRDEHHAVVADYVDRINHELAKISGMGVIVESPELGLVDFPARMEGKDVFLCWRLGEGEVGWWHHPGEGLLGRQAIEDTAHFYAKPM